MPTKEELEAANAAMTEELEGAAKAIEESETAAALLRDENKSLTDQIVAHHAELQAAQVAGANAQATADEAMRRADEAIEAAQSGVVHFDPVWMYPSPDADPVLCKTQSQLDAAVKRGCMDTPDPAAFPLAGVPEGDGQGNDGED